MKPGRQLDRTISGSGAPVFADLWRRVLVDRYGVRASVAAGLRDSMREHRLQAGACLVEVGAAHPWIEFVEEGLLRIFYSSSDGREHNKAFVSEGMFFVALASHLEGEPVRFSVQALEPVRTRRMPYAEFERRVEAEPDLAALWRRYMEDHFRRHEDREAVLQLEDAEGRYRWFVERYPDLVGRLPLYQVASYLGVTNVTISRVRARRGRVAS